MAVRGWGASIATAIGVAAGAGAAQLGLGYGLDIVTWSPTDNANSEATWIASLAWATWIAATSVVAGAITADRLSEPPEWAGQRAARAVATGAPATEPDATDSVAAKPAATDPAAARPPAQSAASGTANTPLASALWRLALAVAAAVGALATAALVAVPARFAERADTFSPQTIAAGYAVVGVIVGMVVAVGALASRAVATNVIATVGWLWLLAVIAVVDGVTDGRGLANAQLGVWHFTSDDKGYWFRNMYLPAVALSLGSALVIGALAGLPAARRSQRRVGIAVSGAVGPLLVAAAYFLAAPRLVGVRPEQLSAYLVAPYAVIAGLAGSVLISTVCNRGEWSSRARRAGGTATDGWARGDLEATDELVGWLSGTDMARASESEPGHGKRGRRGRSGRGHVSESATTSAAGAADGAPAKDAAKRKGAGRAKGSTPAPL